MKQTLVDVVVVMTVVPLKAKVQLTGSDALTQIVVVLIAIDELRSVQFHASVGGVVSTATHAFVVVGSLPFASSQETLTVE